MAVYNFTNRYIGGDGADSFSRLIKDAHSTLEQYPLCAYNRYPDSLQLNDISVRPCYDDPDSTKSSRFAFDQALKNCGDDATKDTVFCVCSAYSAAFHGHEQFNQCTDMLCEGRDEDMRRAREVNKIILFFPCWQRFDRLNLPPEAFLRTATTPMPSDLSDLYDRLLNETYDIVDDYPSCAYNKSYNSNLLYNTPVCYITKMNQMKQADQDLLQGSRANFDEALSLCGKNKTAWTVQCVCRLIDSPDLYNFDRCSDELCKGKEEDMKKAREVNRLLLDYNCHDKQVVIFEREEGLYKAKGNGTERTLLGKSAVMLLVLACSTFLVGAL